jgi:hypothetical protein
MQTQNSCVSLEKMHLLDESGLIDPAGSPANVVIGQDNSPIALLSLRQ